MRGNINASLLENRQALLARFPIRIHESRGGITIICSDGPRTVYDFVIRQRDGGVRGSVPKLRVAFFVDREVARLEGL